MYLHDSPDLRALRRTWWPGCWRWRWSRGPRRCSAACWRRSTQVAPTRQQKRNIWVWIGNFLLHPNINIDHDHDHDHDHEKMVPYFQYMYILKKCTYILHNQLTLSNVCRKEKGINCDGINLKNLRFHQNHIRIRSDFLFCILCLCFNWFLCS